MEEEIEITSDRNNFNESATLNNTKNNTGSGSGDLNNVNTGGPIECIDDTTGKKVYNNWSEQNLTTVRYWKKNMLKSIIIYGFANEQYKKRINLVTMTAMILGYISTLIAAIMSALTAIRKPSIWIIFGFSIASLCINTTITILNTAIKMSNWQRCVTQYSRFVDKLDSFYATISNILMLPDKLRLDAVVFIKKQNKEYLRLTRQTPDLNPSDYNKANLKYRKFMENSETDYTLDQKYGHMDDIITLI